jgi:hypothetical protein
MLYVTTESGKLKRQVTFVLGKSQEKTISLMHSPRLLSANTVRTCSVLYSPILQESETSVQQSKGAPQEVHHCFEETVKWDLEVGIIWFGLLPCSLFFFDTRFCKQHRNHRESYVLGRTACAARGIPRLRDPATWGLRPLRTCVVFVSCRCCCCYSGVHNITHSLSTSFSLSGALSLTLCCTEG